MRNPCERDARMWAHTEGTKISLCGVGIVHVTERPGANREHSRADTAQEFLDK